MALGHLLITWSICGVAKKMCLVIGFERVFSFYEIECTFSKIA
jgi:hypothetical protein